MKKKIFKPFNIGAVEPVPNMTREELKIRLFELLPKVLLASIPDNIDDDNDPGLRKQLKEIYDSRVADYKFKFPGIQEAQIIDDLKHKLTEFDLTIHSMTERIKVGRFLQFLEEQRKNISKPLKPQKEITFEDLFKDKDKAQKVKDIFKRNGYTIEGKWEGLSDNKSELLTAYYVLKPLLKPVLKDTPRAKIFYSEFGLPEDYISDRMLTKEPFKGDIRLEFEQIFSDLLHPKK